MEDNTIEFLEEVIDNMSCEKMRELLKSNIKSGNDKVTKHDENIEHHEVVIEIEMSYTIQ